MSKWGKISYLVGGLSLLIMLVARLILQGWIDYLYIPFFLGLAAIVLALIVDYKFYLEFFTMKTTKHGMNMGVIILLAFILIVAVNFLGVQFDHTFDMTRNKINTLSDQSLTALAHLKHDLNLLVFYRSGENQQLRVQLRANFEKYLDASGKVKLKFVNALTHPSLARQYLEHQQFAVIADYEGRRVEINAPYGEQQTTSAILRVEAKQQKTIYFLTGHGERSIDGNQSGNISGFAKELRNEGYKVAQIDLMKGDKLPTPPGVVVIDGPTSPYLPAEIGELRKFAMAGGRLMICIDPGTQDNLAQLTNAFGIEFHNNYVINEFEQLNELGPLAALGAEYDRNNPITKKFYIGGRVMGSIFLVASEVTPMHNAPSGLTLTPIVKTSPEAYVSNNPKPMANPQHRVVTLAVAAHGQLDSGAKTPTTYQKNFEAVVFGDSDFTDNSFFRFGANQDLAMNSVAWLADDLTNISIRPRTPTATPLELTSTNQIIFLLSGLGLPLFFIILSGFFWYRRRSL